MNPDGYPLACEVAISLSGADLQIRPIRPDDALAESAFVHGLSDASVQSRFMMSLHELPPKMLEKFTHVDYRTTMALVAIDPTAAAATIVGVARYSGDAARGECEFAVTVADAWQGRGLGHLLMTRLIDYARAIGYRRMIGFVLSTNHSMLQLARHLGFRAEVASDDPTVHLVTLSLIDEEKAA